MPIAELLRPEHVVVGLRVNDKTQLLHELARRAAVALQTDASSIFQALQSRETLGSTGLGKGFALPHARLDGLREFFGMFVRLAKPIDFAAIDGEPVDLVFLLLIPPDAAGQHLAALAAIARPLRTAGFPHRLRKAKDAAELHTLMAQ
jgi:PTS system nitrogen regulatory IIA component